MLKEEIDIKNKKNITINELDEVTGGYIMKNGNNEWEIIDDNNGSVIETIPRQANDGYLAAGRAEYHYNISPKIIYWPQLNELRKKK